MGDQFDNYGTFVAILKPGPGLTMRSLIYHGLKDGVYKLVNRPWDKGRKTKGESESMIMS